MEKSKIHQIQLSKLLFTQNWEDPESDHRALDIKPGETMMTITSGGCNTLGFLSKAPGKIFGIDINGSQNWQMELKVESMRAFSHSEYLAFLGLTPSSTRWADYQRIRPKLSEEAQVFWDAKKSIVNKGFLINGRFERFVKIAGKAVRVLQGGKAVRGLFDCSTLEEQQRYYERHWKKGVMRYIFKLFFNKKMLAKRGLDADYFHFDDGASSFAESFHNRFQKALRDIPANSNYFLSIYLMGKYHSLSEVPLYLQKDHYGEIKERLGHIQLVTQDAKKWLASMPDESIDCYSLSNICELMSLEDVERLFTEVVRTARPGARICFRNLMVPREIPDSLSKIIRKDARLSGELLAMDRSFVYGKVAAYRIVK